MFAKKKSDSQISGEMKDINLYKYVDAESIMYKLGYEIRDFPKELLEAHPRSTIRYAKDYMYRFLGKDSHNPKTILEETQKDLDRLYKLMDGIEDSDQKRYLSEFDSIVKYAGLRLSKRKKEEEKNKNIIRKAWEKETQRIARNRAKAKETVGEISRWPSRLGLGVLGGIAVKLAISSMPENLSFLDSINLDGLKDQEDLVALGAGTLITMGSGLLIDRVSEYKDKKAERKYTRQLEEEDRIQSNFNRAIIIQTFAEIGNMGHDAMSDYFHKFDHMTKDQIDKEIKKYKNKYSKYTKK